MTRHLLPGTITPDGLITSTPVIVTLLPDGSVGSWEPLDGHEPHSTTPLRALLRFPDLSLIPL